MQTKTSGLLWRHVCVRDVSSTKKNKLLLTVCWEMQPEVKRWKMYRHVDEEFVNNRWILPSSSTSVHQNHIHQETVVFSCSYIVRLFNAYKEMDVQNKKTWMTLWNCWSIVVFPAVMHFILKQTGLRNSHDLQFASQMKMVLGEGHSDSREHLIGQK